MASPELATEALFALALLILAGLMVTMRSRSYLHMDERGLKIKYVVGAPRLYACADIEAARIFKKRLLMVPVLSTIGLKLRQTARSESELRRAAGSFAGRDVTFLAVYDENAEQILEKIQMYKRNHGTA